MDTDRSDRDESPVRDRRDVGAYNDDLDLNGIDKSSKRRSKDRKKSSRGEDKDQRSKDRKDLDKDRKERRRDDRDERDKERSRDRDRHREKDLDRKERENDKERGKEKGRDKEKERDKGKEKEREKGREKHKDREKDKDREKAREKNREKERDVDLDKDWSRERDKMGKKTYEEDYDIQSEKHKLDYDDRERDVTKQGKGSYSAKDERNVQDLSSRTQAPSLEIEDRILRMKEERLKTRSEGASEVLTWVSKSRKLEEKRSVDKEKVLQLAKMFEEQDNITGGDSEDEEAGKHNTRDLAGVKVLHGLDKVMEGGAVVLTLKDQSILADGDINKEYDMLENIEIGEQKRRDEAYKAAKKKTGIYDDKFNDDPTSEKKMLPQYDEPAAEEGVTLDARGRFTGEAEKKLEELRRRIQGDSANNRFEDLSVSAKRSSDYYTQEEMLQFKKPKKKKSLRKKEKLDLDALEAEAVSSGLGVEDLGSRNDGRRHAVREEKERAEAQTRSNAYQSALAKADEATKSLRMEQILPVKMEEDEDAVIADDNDELYESLERARKLALKKQEEAAYGPQAIALLATTTSSNHNTDDQNPSTGESQENKVVFTEMEDFVWGLQLNNEEAHKPDHEDVFMDEDEGPRASEQEIKDEPGGWTEVKETDADEKNVKEDKEEIVPDQTIHEVAVGKGLSGALKLLKDRGTLKESIEWGGRNMDKKKSKLIGIVDDNAAAAANDRFKDIRIERTDEFGRIMTPKEAFRMISHKFHGKGPGKMKQEKRMKQYQEELKLKQMKNSDTPSLSVERMREAQAQLKTPYLVLSGHVKPGQTSDPRSGFATVEKDLPGGLTPMLGNSKVEHFLGIKRKADGESTGTPKKPKT